MLLPPLIEKWRSLPNDSDELYGLFECLTAVSLALGIDCLLVLKKV